MSAIDWTEVRTTLAGLADNLGSASVRTGLLIGAAALAALLMVRRIGAKRTAVNVAVLIGLGASLESSWMVAGAVLELNGAARAIPAALFESAFVATAARLVEHHRTHSHGGKYVTWMWTFAGGASIVYAVASNTRGEAALRFAIPLVATAVWYGDYLAEQGKSPVTWLLSPRRIGIRLGVIAPGMQDLTEEQRKGRIDALARTAHRYHHGGTRWHSWHAARLRRLALAADDAMVAEAQRRVDRVHRIEALTKPRDLDPSGPDRTPDRTPVPDPATGPDRTTDRTTVVDPGPDHRTVNGRTPTMPVRTPIAALVRTLDRTADEDALRTLRTLRTRLQRTPSLEEVRTALTVPGEPRCGKGRAVRLRNKLTADDGPDPDPALAVTP